MSHDKGGKDTQLGGSAQQQALGIGNQRTEVGHRTNAQENEAGIDAQLDTDVEDVQKSAVGQYVAVVMVVWTCCVQELVVPELCVEQVRTREVGEQHTERDRQKQQRLILLDYGQIEQHAGDDQHNQRLPSPFSCEHLCKAGLFAKIAQGLTKVEILCQDRHSHEQCHKEQ